MTFLEYLQSRRELLLAQTLEHATIVLMSVALATVIGVLVALWTYRNPRTRAVATGIAAAMLTIPSFALLGLLIAPLGLGYTPTLVALTMYALLPILRNTIVGLSEIDPALTEAARGIGMSRLRSLSTVEIPLAWPVILTGIRVSTQMTMGIAAVGAYVGGPGLGNQIFSGLANLGGVNSLNQALVGTVGVIVLALTVDFALALLGKLTRAGHRPKLFRPRPARRPTLTPTTAVPSPSLGGRE
ncbi:ABC transporter permease [Salinispora vitiensis]|uniref:ABC transporter permease n=1 Tax=Salinispora vitiensis TaxID=999544 RepID=UPI00036D52DE|nr:ABC transporter permease [Salinispora vitiensis]